MTERHPVRREAAPDAVQVLAGAVGPNSTAMSGAIAAEECSALFARAREGLLRDQLGLSEASELARFRVVQSALQQRRPLHAGDTYRVDARMLGWKPSYLHVFFQLWQGSEIAAACQELLLYTEGQQTSEVAMPTEAQTSAARLYRNQEGLPLPLGADSTIVLP